jgi:myo-inositol 2-dehydrogenase / D-chiro-inositol 1-dehydrogenase
VKTIRYGVIGCGMMGQEHLRNIALLPGAEVAAIFEPDAGMAARAIRLAPRARLCESAEAVMIAADIDCLLIASPNQVHLSQLEQVVESRPLPVLVEKPLFTDPSSAARIARLRDACRGQVWVAMEYRYMPAVARLLAEAQAATGGIVMLTIREHRFPFLDKVGAWNRFNRNTGGTFVEKCCHFFDLMRLAIGADPVRITASAGQAVNHKDEIHGGERPDIWDHGYVIVEFEGGPRAMLELCMFAEGAKFQEEISAVGRDGKIEAFVPGPTRFWPKALGAPPVAEVVVSPRAPKGPRVTAVPVDPALLAAGDHNGATYYQHQRFAAVVRGEATPDVTFDDGWWAVAMGIAAQRAAAEGRAVVLADEGLAPPRAAARAAVAV